MKNISSEVFKEEEEEDIEVKNGISLMESKIDEESSCIQGDNESDDFDESIPKPPDGGWGWVVLFASFLCNFLVDGIAYSFGVFLNDYAEHFKATRAGTSLASALLCGFYLIIGPIVSGMVNKFGLRLVGIVGSLIASGGFILSTFSTSLLMFQLIFGLVGGLGFGMMYLPAVVSVGFYFEKKRALATGIAVCGAGIGTFCIAPIGGVLLDNYGWQGSHYILAGMILHGCAASALMRPLVIETKQLPTNTTSINKEVNDRNQTEPNSTLQMLSSKTSGASEQVKAFSPISRSSHTVGQFSSMKIPSQRLHASMFLTQAGYRDRSSIIEDLKRPMYRKDIFFGGSARQLNELRACSTSIASMEQSVITYTGHLSCLRKLPKPMADILVEMLDFNLLKNRGMLALCIGNAVGLAGFYVPILFSADRAQLLGVNKQDSVILLSYMGICNTIGRALSGVVSSIPYISPLLTIIICCIISGVCVIITPFCTSYASMVLVIVGYGLFGSAFISLASVIMCDLIGLEKLTNGFGILCLVRGIAAITAPPLEGLLYDSTGNYDATFYMGGTCILLCAALHSLLYMNCSKTQANTNLDSP